MLTATSRRERARWGLLLAARPSGLGQGPLNCFIWGCFYRILKVKVKDACRFYKPKLIKLLPETRPGRQPAAIPCVLWGMPEAWGLLVLWLG